MRGHFLQHLLLFLPPTWGLWLFLLLPSQAYSFSWPKLVTELSNNTPAQEAATFQRPVTQGAKPASDLPKLYGIALRELQELESEPLCHRIAARLLIHNCQILDGKDEATALTDSGRATRDFVDAYAASLAICDLERGSFQIPSSCAKFQEAALSHIPVPTAPKLHASTAEIDGCLAGLAQSDSAWNTWVSYRDKAFRFCEAARAENEKDRNIFLYRKLTKILERLTTEVDSELEARFASFNQVIQDSSEKVEGLTPKIDRLIKELKELERVLVDNIHDKAEEASRSVEDSAEKVKDLQSLLLALIHTTTENNAELVAAHRSAVQTSVNDVEIEVASLTTTIATIALASTALQRDIEHSRKQIEDIAKQQSSLQTSMDSLMKVTSELSQSHKEHQETLKSAQKDAENILSTVLTISHSATTFQSSISRWFSWSGWWPHIFCPTVSLVLGSYGLPPSVGRNILLVGLGEVVGLAISTFSKTTQFSFYPFAASSNKTNTTTADLDQQTYANSSCENETSSG